MKEIRTKILKHLAIKSLRYFTDKAKTLKKDPILVKMLYSDNVVFDQVTGLMMEVEGGEFDFFQVKAIST